MKFGGFEIASDKVRYYAHITMGKSVSKVIKTDEAQIQQRMGVGRENFVVFGGSGRYSYGWRRNRGER